MFYDTFTWLLLALCFVALAAYVLSHVRWRHQRRYQDALLNAAVATCTSSPASLHDRLVALRRATAECARVMGWRETLERMARLRVNHLASLRALSIDRVPRCGRCDDPIDSTQGVVWNEAEGAVHLVCAQEGDADVQR